MKRYLFSTLLILFQLSGFGQPIFKQISGPTIRNSALQPLKLGFAGGVWTPQLQEIDLNGNGINDLVVFDRADQSITTFLKQQTGPTTYAYVHAPAYQPLFPQMQDWFMLVDYDNDGKIDLFTSGNGTVQVFKNIGNQGARFRMITNDLKADYGFGVRANLFVNNPDYPVIVDIDRDGDVDILTGSSGIGMQGFTVNWFKNLSMEKFGRPDSLDFVLHDQCWGKFAEDIFNSSIILGLDSTCYLPQGPRPIGNNERVQHMGTTLAVADLNGNGIYDVLIGDVSYGNIIALNNGGTHQRPLITSYDSTFPAYNIPIDVPYFPACFRVQVGEGGKKDLIVAPNEPFGDFISNQFTKRKKSIWLYKNVGTANKDSFLLENNSFLQEDMIDGFEFSAPVIFDQNGDGLSDLLQFTIGYNRKLTLKLYYNTGTNAAPIYSLIDTNWLNLQQYNWGRAFPTIGDLDGDQIPDMLLGFSNGNIAFLKGQVGAGYQIFNLVNNTFLSLGPFAAVPELFDYNQDGKLDLLIGRRNGRVSLYRNDGTTTNPSFTIITDSLGKIDVNPYPGFSSQAYPRVADLDLDGKPDLVIGTDYGNMLVYYSTEFWENPNVRFLLNDSCLISFESNYQGPVFVGRNCYPYVAQLNNDNFPDLVVGTDRGGMLIFENATAFVGLSSIRDLGKIDVFPNPVQDVVFISLNDAWQGNLVVNLFDLQGRVVQQQSIFAQSLVNISLQNLPSGFYIMEVVNANKSLFARTKISKH